MLPEGVVLVVDFALGDFLVAVGLALVLVALAAVVGRVLVLGEHLDLLPELLLVLHPVLLDLALQQQQLFPLPLDLLHLLLV